MSLTIESHLSSNTRVTTCVFSHFQYSVFLVNPFFMLKLDRETMRAVWYHLLYSCQDVVTLQHIIQIWHICYICYICMWHVCSVMIPV